MHQSALEVTEFRLKEIHLKLLERIEIVFKGAQQIGYAASVHVSQYRPYGNLDYVMDIAELMGLKRHPEAGYSRHYDDILLVHNQMPIAMSIRLQINSELTPGLYIRPSIAQPWERQND